MFDSVESSEHAACWADKASRALASSKLESSKLRDKERSIRFISCFFGYSRLADLFGFDKDVWAHSTAFDRAIDGKDTAQ